MCMFVNIMTIEVSKLFGRRQFKITVFGVLTECVPELNEHFQTFRTTS